MLNAFWFFRSPEQKPVSLWMPSRRWPRISAAQIQPAPELSKEQMRIISQIANLGDRMILLVESSQLLNRIESDMLAEFDHASARQELQIS